MKLRNATPRDAKDIASLHADSWKHAYRGALSDDYLEHHAEADRQALWKKRLSTLAINQRVVVAEAEHRLLGFACVLLDDHQQWGSLLDNIHVARTHHGQGLGTKLLWRVASECMSRSTGNSLYLWVLQSNHSAQRFYRNRGAACLGHDIWSPPGGGAVPRYRLGWANVSTLVDGAANA